MNSFIAFALYLCVSAFLLVAVPLMMHPTLPVRRKLLFCSVVFFLLVPLGLLIYAIIGAPPMAAV